MRGLIALGVVAWFSVPAAAADITIGLSAAPSSADPYFHQLGPNITLASHVFDPLIDTDAKLTLQPNLATAWTLEGDRTWRLSLRPDVRFQDGTPFTAQDVVYSLCRVLHPSGPTGSYQSISRNLAGVEVIDPLTLRLKMREPSPSLLSDLSGLYIISAHSAGAVGTKFDLASRCGDLPTPAASAFDSGAMANGTGPYRLQRYSSGEQLTLAANPDYHGRKPHWDHVTMRALPNAGARLAGLLAGELDLIENPSAQDLPTIQKRGGLAWSVVPSNRIIYLQPDVARDPSPLARDVRGRNPLRDPRVRRAISLSIDRAAIAARLMDGLAVPADRYTAPGLFGAQEGPAKLAYDPARARALLAEAGETGIGLTLSATRDRYVNDASVAQAIGQYLTRVGIRTTVEAMPGVNFFPGRAKRDFSLAMGGWGTSSEGAANFLRIWLAQTDPVRGIGGSNYGGYASPAFDATLIPALSEMDDAKRATLLRMAERMALDDDAIIPLYWETSVWAFKDAYSYEGRADQRTDADDLSLKATR